MQRSIGCKRSRLFGAGGTRRRRAFSLRGQGQPLSHPQQEARRPAGADPPRAQPRASGLGDKLANVVWQLSQNFHRNLERLETFARALRYWRGVRHAMNSVTLRGSTMRSRRARASIVSRSASPMLRIGQCGDVVTSDLVYVRLHGHRAHVCLGLLGSEAPGLGREAAALDGRRARGARLLRQRRVRPRAGKRPAAHGSGPGQVTCTNTAPVDRHSPRKARSVSSRSSAS